GFEQGEQLVVSDLAERPPGRDSRAPQCFGPPEVPDPRHEPLVEERVADLTSLRADAQSGQHRLVVGRLAEDVGAEPRRTTCVDELEHGAVPEHTLVLAAPQHEPGLPRTHRPPALDPPATLHPQMAPQHEAALEGE